MKVLHAHLFFEVEGIKDICSQTRSCSATVFVEGFGKVEISNCLSQETFDRIASEAEMALRIKLGQKCEAVNKESESGVII